MKFILSFLIILCFALTLQAQIISGYGLKIGATSSGQEWDYKYLNDFTPETRWGINVGVFAELFKIPYFNLVAELNYVQKGMKDELKVTTPQSPDTGEYITWDTRIDYINISALGKLRLELSKFVPYVLLGPKVDFEINDKTSPESTNSVAENYNEVLFGFKTGIGCEIKFNSISVLAEILYDYNFNNLYDGEYLTVTSDSFDFRLGILL
jgi:hypothetical protein